MWKWKEIQKLLRKKSVIARVTKINEVNINMKIRLTNSIKTGYYEYNRNRY